MSPLVVSIVLLSAFMHAGWNLIARYERSESQVYKKMLIFIGLVGFLPAVISEWLTRSMTPLAWYCVLGAGISAGQRVTIVPDALPDVELTGTVDKIANYFEEKRGDITYTVRILVNDADPRLRWGMTVVTNFEEQ